MEYVQARKQSRIKALKWLGGVGGSAVLLMIYSLIKRDEHSENYAFLLELGLAFPSVVNHQRYRGNAAKMAPYFEKPVPGETHWSEAIARNCRELDALAVRMRVRPLSAFGFTDDWPDTGIHVLFHRPEFGVETLAALLGNLNNSPVLDAEASKLEKDLHLLHARLLEAVQSDTRFRFLLHEGVPSAMEVEQRKGFF